MNDMDVLSVVAAAFEECCRPEHFTDHTHCCECAEHDELLRNRNRDTLTLADVGNPGWDPICFVTNDGFKYYFPALARLALIEPTDKHGWYLEQLLFHLNDKDTPQNRRRACPRKQRDAIVCFLRYVQETRYDILREYRCDDQLKDTIALWANSMPEPAALPAARRSP